MLPHLCEGILWAKRNSLQGKQIDISKCYSARPHGGSCLQKVIPRQVMGVLTNCPLGNVRELADLIERAVVLAQVLIAELQAFPC